jgi:hypothetical protein
MKASAEGVEMTERALRTAEIDLCRHKLEMIRASEVNMEAIKVRHRRNVLWREAKRARERKRGAPMTLFGVHSRYIESIGDESGPKLPCLAQAEPRGSSPKP